MNFWIKELLGEIRWYWRFRRGWIVCLLIAAAFLAGVLAKTYLF